MDPSTCRGLAFLLSFGTLPIACTPDPKNSTDSGTGSTGGTDGTGDATDGHGTTGTPTSTTAGSATGSVTDSDDPTGGASEPCQVFADYRIECDPTSAPYEADIIMYCSLERTRRAAINGPECAALFDAYLECHATASCDDPDPCDDAFYTAVTCVPAPGPLCMAYAAKLIECDPEQMMYDPAGYCQVYINYGAYVSGPACATALDEYFACLAALSCAELMMEDSCPSESTKVGELCELGDDGPPARPTPPLRAR